MDRMLNVLTINPTKNKPHHLHTHAEQHNFYQDIFIKQSQLQPERALCELLSIPSYQAKNQRQPYSSLSKLYQAAPNAQRELEIIAAKTVMIATSGNVISSGVKALNRATEKVKKELLGDVARITDLVRITVSANSIDSLTTIYNTIAASVQTISVLNRFKSPRPSGYRDIKMLIKLPESKLIAEIQLHLSAIAEVKNNKEHHIYRQIQKIERRATTAFRHLSDFEMARINQLNKKSRRLYDIAWQRYHFLDEAI